MSMSKQQTDRLIVKILLGIDILLIVLFVFVLYYVFTLGAEVIGLRNQKPSYCQCVQTNNTPCETYDDSEVDNE